MNVNKLTALGFSIAISCIGSYSCKAADSSWERPVDVHYESDCPYSTSTEGGVRYSTDHSGRTSDNGYRRSDYRYHSDRHSDARWQERYRAGRAADRSRYIDTDYSRSQDRMIDGRRGTVDQDTGVTGGFRSDASRSSADTGTSGGVGTGSSGAGVNAGVGTRGAGVNAGAGTSGAGVNAGTSGAGMRSGTSTTTGTGTGAGMSDTSGRGAGMNTSTNTETSGSTGGSMSGSTGSGGRGSGMDSGAGSGGSTGGSSGSSSGGGGGMSGSR
jgi:hypothetical protein